MSIFGISLFGSEHVLSENEHHFECWIKTVVSFKRVSGWSVYNRDTCCFSLFVGFCAPNLHFLLVTCILSWFFLFMTWLLLVFKVDWSWDKSIIICQNRLLTELVYCSQYLWKVKYLDWSYQSQCYAELFRPSYLQLEFAWLGNLRNNKQLNFLLVLSICSQQNESSWSLK